METKILKKISNNSRTAIILCGGKGTRLGALGKKIPKTLIKIQGTQIIFYILSELIKYKFNNIILPIGYKGYMIENLINKNKILKTKVKLVRTGNDTNIGKRISLVEKFIKSENTLLLNGDAIFNFNIEKILLSHEKRKADITFLSGEITYPYGTIGVKKNNVVDFKRNLQYDALKIRNNLNYTAYNYTGIAIIKTKILRKYKSKYRNFSNFEAQLYPTIVKKYKSNLIRLNSFWHSIDNLKDVAAVNLKGKDNKKYLEIKKLKKKLIVNENK